MERIQQLLEKLLKEQYASTVVLVTLVTGKLTSKSSYASTIICITLKIHLIVFYDIALNKTIHNQYVVFLLTILKLVQNRLLLGFERTNKAK